MQRALRLLVSIPLLLVCAACLAGRLWVESAVLAVLCFLLLYPWAPLPRAAARGGGIGAGKLVLLVLGALVAAAGPLVVAVLGALSTQLPGCSIGGSGGPAYGCRLAGTNVDGLIGLVTPAFVLSFVTVPAGLLLMLIGAMLPRPKPVAVDKWIAAAVRVEQPAPVMPEAKARTPRPASRIAIDDAVQEALLNYRAGCLVRTRCPSCHSVLLVAPAGRGPAPLPDRFKVACACGACDSEVALR